jgi:hypothetical protein
MRGKYTKLIPNEKPPKLFFSPLSGEKVKKNPAIFAMA